MTPPINPIATPAGTFNLPDSPEQRRATDIRQAHADLERCKTLRAQALATPIGPLWDEMDMATYMLHLDETEARLRGKL